MNNTSTDLSAEKKELQTISLKINNSVKGILSDIEIPELTNKLDHLRIGKSELEDIIARNELCKKKIDREKLLALLKESKEKIESDTKSVIKCHITELYAHKDGTVSVNMGVHTTTSNCIF